MPQRSSEENVGPHHPGRDETVAVKARFFKPMLCLAVEKLPEGPAWQYEVKLDGYRAIGVRTNQAHAMLAGTRVPLPQLDEFFPIAEAPLRAEEFAELGWTEAEIWRE